jgi:hypothetical protein
MVWDQVVYKRWCEAAAREEEAEAGRVTESKTRTPHKDVGKKLCVACEKIDSNVPGCVFCSSESNIICSCICWFTVVYYFYDLIRS